MKRMRVLMLVAVFLAGFVLTGLPSQAAEETVDIWKAAWTGNLEVINQHLAAVLAHLGIAGRGTGFQRSIHQPLHSIRFLPGRWYGLEPASGVGRGWQWRLGLEQSSMGGRRRN